MLPENEEGTFYEPDCDILCWKIKHSKENEGNTIPVFFQIIGYKRKGEADFKFAAMLTKSFMQFRINLSLDWQIDLASMKSSIDIRGKHINRGHVVPTTVLLTIN